MPVRATTGWGHETDERVPLTRLVTLVRPSLRLVWRASRSETILVVALQALLGLALPAQLLAGKLALDSVLEASRTDAGLERALPAVVVVIVVIAAARVLFATSMQRRPLLPELVRRTVHEMLARKAASLDLETLETPAFHDRLSHTQRQAAFRPANMVSDITQVISAGVAVIGLLVLLATVQPLLVLLILAAFVPLWWANIDSGRAFYRFHVGDSSRYRLITYVEGLLTSLDSAKETRAFGLGPYLLEAQGRLFDERLVELRAVIRKRWRRDVLASLVSSAVSAAGLLLILWLHFSGRTSLSDTAVAVGAMLLMVPRLSALAGSVGLFHENALFIEDFWSFLELTPGTAAAPSAHGAPEKLDRVAVDDVSFTYRDSPNPALRGVSLEIGRGETVALVGENGAGKTTLAKLLCRLYDPDGGTIAWDGRDLTTCDPVELRRRIAVIFQDFVRYQLSGRENIGFGDLEAIDEPERIAAAARRAGAHEFLRDLPDGYETVLGRLFDEGHELSIGQWQKIALARAFFREAPLVIMDEPTASLDARAEYELFETMRDLFDDRAVLLISHRFSSVRMADRIYVLRDGEVIESGSHDELAAQGGLYSELFALQASNYVQGRPNGSAVR